MAGTRELGEKMETAPPRAVQEKAGPSWHQEFQKWAREVKKYLETAVVFPEIPDVDTRVHDDLVLELSAAAAFGVRGGYLAEYTSLTTGSSGASSAPATASISPVIGSLVVAVLWHSSGAVPTSVTGNGITYTHVGGNGGAGDRIEMYVGSPLSNGAITFNYAASEANSVWAVTQVENVATVNPTVQFTTGTTLSNNLHANSPLIAGHQNGAGAGPTSEAGWTQINTVTSGVNTVRTYATLGAEAFNYGGYNTTNTTTNVTRNIMAELRPGNRWLSSTTTGGSGWITVPLRVGDRIKQVNIHGRHVGATGTFTGALWRINKTTGLATQVGTATSATGVTADEELVISGLSETVAADIAYYIEWTASATAAQRCYGASITYDHPA